ncbi:MAG: cellulase family glycosylhydrolase [Sphingobacteriia bacterium]
MLHQKSRYYFLLFCFTVFCSLFGSISAQYTIPNFQDPIQQKFKAGINISYFENYWKSEEELMNNCQKVMEKVVLTHQLGFSSIRLPVAFQNYLLPGTNKISSKLLKQLKVIHEFTASKNMNLIIVDFYGLANKYQDLVIEEEQHAYIWKQVLAEFYGLDYEHLFFDMYNDPIVDIKKWDIAKSNIIKLLRPLDLNRYWILSCTNYCDIDAFIQMKPVLNDDKIIYSFHFFRPYIFTHQGAPWDSEKTSLNGLPYPHSLTDMPLRPEGSLNTNLLYNYDHYYEKANRTFINESIKLVYDWMIAYKVPVICTETGTINTIPLKYRENYFNDVFSVMKTYGIPTMIWDLDQCFSIIDKQKKTFPAISNWIKSFE